MTFLECVNRVLRLNAVIRGDTDTVTTFSDTAHNATLNLAIVAIQDELGDLVADKMIPYEKGAGTTTLATNTRTATLASDFTRFYGEPHFYDSTGNRQIYEYPGGQETLQLEIFTYKTDYGSPNYWYWEPATTKQVGFYQVPNSTYNGRVLSYDYEKSVMVSLSTDTMPFHNTEEANQFTIMCARRFKVLFEDVDKIQDVAAVLDVDRTYNRAKGSLLKFIVGVNPSNRYASVYR